MDFENMLETVRIKSEDVAIPERYDNLNIGSDTLNFCQTCLASGRNSNLKNMTQKHSYGNEYEVYSDMLHYCFGQEFVNMKRSENIYLICEDCIEKLRNVLNFKKQVEDVQKKIMSNFELQSFSPAPHTELQKSSNKEFDDINQEILALLANDSSTGFSDESYEESPEINSSVIDDVPNDKSLKVTRNIMNQLSPNKTPVQVVLYGKYDRSYKKLPYTLESDDVQCKICNKVCDTPTNLQLHMPIHFPNYICDICGNVSASGYQFDMHMETHTSKYECHLCQKIYKRRDYLQRHTKFKHGTEESLYKKCRYCSQSFISFTSKQRERHLQIVHSVEPRKYKCKLCEAVLDTSGRRATHIRKFHMTECKHVCNICHAAFREKKHLTIHMLKHTGIKKYNCTVCTKKYLRSYTLKEHMKIHTGEKKYSCDICQKAFTQKCTLIGHMAVHKKK